MDGPIARFVELIRDGSLDEELANLDDAIRRRRYALTLEDDKKRRADEMSTVTSASSFLPGEPARLSMTMRPQYIAGAEVEILERVYGAKYDYRVRITKLRSYGGGNARFRVGTECRVSARALVKI